eukprot:3483273-Rhodomonas_salina.1
MEGVTCDRVRDICVCKRDLACGGDNGSDLGDTGRDLGQYLCLGSFFLVQYCVAAYAVSVPVIPEEIGRQLERRRD